MGINGQGTSLLRTCGISRILDTSVREGSWEFIRESLLLSTRSEVDLRFISPHFPFVMDLAITFIACVSPIVSPLWAYEMIPALTLEAFVSVDHRDGKFFCDALIPG